jgi:peptidoglycan/LPS O-acetylase OafA/YrhL
MKYRAEIDGLRALAVVPVILFHAGFELFSGGFVGVDVFFVISGYLITTILIEDIENQRFSLVNFYERRARRILPALFFVMLVCIPFAWMWMLPTQIKDFSQSLVAVSLFASNVLFWRESGYFDAASEEKPLLHTWSLAVEVQYYVLFPIFLFLAWRYGKNRVFWIIVVMASVSLLLSEWGWRNKPTANFYLAPTRAWELFAGSIAAFIVQKQGVQKNNLLALLGLACIVFSIFAYDKITPFPSVYALVPVVGVVMLILFADKETVAARLLRTKAFVGIGLISYSAYLWHQPLFAFARIRMSEHPSSFWMLVLSAASVALAYISWRYVEKPFRNKEKLSQNTIFGISLLGMAFFVSVGFTGHLRHFDINKVRFGQDSRVLQTYQLLEDAKIESPVFILDNRHDNRDCRFSVLNLDAEIDKRVLDCFERYGAGTMVFGDSHATNLYHSLVRNSENDTAKFLIGVTKNGCHLPANEFGCQYSEILDFVIRNPDVFTSLVYEKAGYLMLEFHGERDELRGSSAVKAEINNRVITGVIDYLQVLSSHVNVTWFGPRIEPLVTEKELLNKTCDEEFIPTSIQLQSYMQLDDFLRNELIGRDINYISQNEVYAFSYPRDFGDCNGLYWMDSNHFSRLGENEFGTRYSLLNAIRLINNE